MASDQSPVAGCELPVAGNQSRKRRAAVLWLATGTWLLVTCLFTACSSPDTERIKETTKPTYDKATGKLIELTFDRNKDGRIDTWMKMDGTRPISAEIDLNEDGKIDRWEYYDKDGKLTKVGFSRGDTGKPDAWAYAGPGGKVARVEVSSTGDPNKISRWEYYDASLAGPNGDATGALVRSEEDTNGDGKVDKWETYKDGQIATVAFDEDFDGKPDRRLTYKDGKLVLIESNPDANGIYRTRKVIK